MRALKSAAPFYRRKARPAPHAPVTRIKTSIGEVGIQEPDGRETVLRPSLYAMSQLGEPEEIVQLLVNVCSDPLTVQEARLQHLNAIAVLAACADHDVRHLTGYHDGTVIVPGKVERNIAVILARRLLQHGVTGALPQEDKSAGADTQEYTKVFDARGYVAMAILDSSYIKR